MTSDFAMIDSDGRETYARLRVNAERIDGVWTVR